MAQTFDPLHGNLTQIQDEWGPTVQRDLEVLLMAGYMIIDGPEPGTYAFPKGYKAHHAFEF